MQKGMQTNCKGAKPHSHVYNIIIGGSQRTAGTVAMFVPANCRNSMFVPANCRNSILFVPSGVKVVFVHHLTLSCHQLRRAFLHLKSEAFRLQESHLLHSVRIHQ